MLLNEKISVPGFQYFMLPFLQVIADGKTRHMNEIFDLVIKNTELTPEQCSILLPSKVTTLVNNRIGWVRTYLYKAGLINQVTRGNYHITQLGKKAIEENPSGIKIKYLRTLPAFQEWGKSSNNESEADSLHQTTLESEITPQENLEKSFQTIMNGIADELLDRIKKVTPAFFEKLVIDVLMAMGYGGFDSSNGHVTQYSGDGGIDGIIKEDKLGLDTIYIQAKRWDNTVPVSAVRDFAGSLLSKKARKGVFITTSSFPQSAYDFVGSIDPKIILIDGEQLTRMMIEYNVAVAKSKAYEIKRIDNDYFEL
jgi:restriction system protein